jgi:hypothetical protein
LEVDHDKWTGKHLCVGGDRVIGNNGWGVEFMGVQVGEIGLALDKVKLCNISATHCGSLWSFDFIRNAFDPS